jgi:hypothetical protein
MCIYVLEIGYLYCGGDVHGIYSTFELGSKELYKLFEKLKNKNKSAQDIKEPDFQSDDKISCLVGNEFINLTKMEVQ